MAAAMTAARLRCSRRRRDGLAASCDGSVAWEAAAALRLDWLRRRCACVGCGGAAVFSLLSSSAVC